MFNQSLPGKIIYNHFNTQIYKESKLYLIFFAITIFSLSIISCSETVAPGLAPQPYMSLTIGDERQIVSITDSSTVQWVITDTLRRSDGQLVFQTKWYYGTGTVPNIQYYLIQDGFFKSTSLDTLRDTTSFVIGSYFGEQKLAKIYLLDNDTWANQFYSHGDTTLSTFLAKYHGQFIADTETFNLCFRFETNFGASIYYAQNIGYVGILLSDSTGSLASYIKINGREYGIKVPPKNSPEWWRPVSQNGIDFLGRHIR